MADRKLTYYDVGGKKGQLSLTDEINLAKVGSLTTPVDDGDASNKKYVDDGLANALLGLDQKEPVRIAVVGNQNIATINTFQDIDGVALVDGDRVLVKDQTDATENGIYVVAGGAAPVRAADLADAASANGVAVWVSEGDTHADTLWRCSTDDGVDVVGTHGLAFLKIGAQTPAAAQGRNEVTAGSSIAKGEPVAISSATNSRHEPAVADSDEQSATVLSVAEEAIAAGDTGIVVTSGLLTGVLVGATRGERVYVAAGGGLTTTIPTTTGQFATVVGYAVSATDLWVRPGEPIELS